MRGIRYCLALLTMLAVLPFAHAENTGEPALRALIVTCDSFLTQEDTTPAAQQNAALMADMLARDARGYASVRTECDTIGSVAALAKAVEEAFADAAEGDISLFYISTHGIYNTARSNLTARLILCDGETEEYLTPQMLESLLAAVPGTHVVLMDACHSGAFIGKGLSTRAEAMPLNGCKVLCSAGGSEGSWYWRSGDSDHLHGAGYFTSILTRGCSADAGYPADEDRDGLITMREAFEWLHAHYAVSTAQVYPEYDDTFPLFKCAGEAEPLGLTDIEFDETVFSGAVSRLRFSFELKSAQRVAYQLVYMQRGAWDFRNAVQLTEPDILEAGYYERVLTLSLPDEDTDVSGYLMVQVFTMDNGRPILHESRLISVLPSSGDVALSVECPPVFRRSPGQEMTITVRHDIPCLLTVQIQSARGETVRYLAFEQQSRPQHLVPEGTCLYWDGLLAGGESAPAGYYMVRVLTEVGGRSYQTYSTLFRVMDDASAG